MDNGQIYSFGNNFGQLGLGDTEDRNSPTLIQNVYNISQISAGAKHSLAISDDGYVYGFGLDNNGQLGFNLTSGQWHNYANIPKLIASLKNIVDVTSGEMHSMALMTNGHVYSFGNNTYGQLGLGNDKSTNKPILIDDLIGIIQISAGEYHSMVLMNDGRVYVFGSNNKGQLGLGDIKNRYNPIMVMSIF